MDNYYVSSRDDEYFIITQSYKKLIGILKKLKIGRNRIIHVIGAPGTGKSANIYHAINELNLNFYDVKLNIPNQAISSREVFNIIFKCLMDDLELESRKDVYKRLGEFDLVLIADNFQDSHRQNHELMGFSQWTNTMGFKSFKFYLLCIWEYLKHWDDFKYINLLFQTSWRIYIMGEKYDLFTDLGILSRFIVFILKRFFTVVEISYSEEETIKIVKNYIPHVDENLILSYIKKYGHKPGFIFNILKSES
jgi:hypothetical protein